METESLGWFCRTGAFQPVEAAQTDANKRKLYRKEICYEGQFVKKKADGTRQLIQATADRLRHWAAEGNRLLAAGHKITMPILHTTNPEANRGEWLGFEVALNGEGKPALFAYSRFRDEEAEKLAASTDVSIYTEVEKELNGVRYTDVPTHICITTQPVIPKLSPFQAIAASLDGEPMLKESLKKLLEKAGIAIPENCDDDKAIALLSEHEEKLRKEKKELEDKLKATSKPPEGQQTVTQPEKVAASLPPAMIGLIAKNRQEALDRLVEKGKVTPAARDEFVKDWADKDKVAVALSNDPEGKDFDALVRGLEKNQALKIGAERTGAQGGDAVVLSNDQGGDQPMTLAERAKLRFGKK